MALSSCKRAVSHKLTDLECRSEELNTDESNNIADSLTVWILEDIEENPA